ncbi:tetraspanin-18-like [Patiria miniata]|uniref:Tetraspanin n=1 Tax=Patiria miniata TaxID=46514 RepID=A0A913ZN55_PATMI|nr:tetraspanin-18-like [Patiria miniata]XP_038052489.1 tetraspanin-18-like [Patiria miniata]XP_038052497.1 tetraspanin-18-like [Patiria miniata]XP_038052504.1 tetraspanin-18-like [Patiria miniata]
MVSFEAPVSTLSCFGKCFKWSLYLFCVLFLFGGIAASGVGVWAIVHPTSFRIVILTNTRMYVFAAIILIGAGAAATLVSVLGCCGARYENRCLLVFFAVSMLLIFVAEFSAGVLSLAFYTQIETFASREMRDAVLLKYGQGNYIETTDAYNYMQQTFDCCGFEGDSHDAAQLYQASLWFDANYRIQVPPSCCTRNPNGEPINLAHCQSRFNTHLAFINNIGCKEAVKAQGIHFATVISAVGIGLAMLQLIGIVLAFCLFRRV